VKVAYLDEDVSAQGFREMLDGKLPANDFDEMRFELPGVGEGARSAGEKRSDTVL
jgi:hypothetical protein